MKYSNTIEPLDKIDCEIFFGKFKRSRMISMIVAFFLDLLIVLIVEEDLQLYGGLFIVTILSSFIFAYGYHEFNKIMLNDKKILQKM